MQIDHNGNEVKSQHLTLSLDPNKPLKNKKKKIKTEVSVNDHTYHGKLCNDKYLQY